MSKNNVNAIFLNGVNLATRLSLLYNRDIRTITLSPDQTITKDIAAEQIQVSLTTYNTIIYRNAFKLRCKII